MLHLISGPTDTRAADSSAQGVRNAFLARINMLYCQIEKLHSIKILKQINLKLSSLLSPEADLALSVLMSSTVRYLAVILVDCPCLYRSSCVEHGPPFPIINHQSSIINQQSLITHQSPITPSTTFTFKFTSQTSLHFINPFSRNLQKSARVLQIYNVQNFLANLAAHSKLSVQRYSSRIQGVTLFKLAKKDNESQARKVIHSTYHTIFSSINHQSPLHHPPKSPSPFTHTHLGLQRKAARTLLKVSLCSRTISYHTDCLLVSEIYEEIRSIFSLPKFLVFRLTANNKHLSIASSLPTLDYIAISIHLPIRGGSGREVLPSQHNSFPTTHSSQQSSSQPTTDTIYSSSAYLSSTPQRRTYSQVASRNTASSSDASCSIT